MSVLQKTNFDCILRELWSDQDHDDVGLTPQDLNQWRAKRERFNLLDRAVKEDFAETRQSGVNGGVRYHST